MPSVLRFPANQEQDPTDLPESPEELFETPGEKKLATTTTTRRSAPTIIPEVSFADEPTRPSHHPGPDLDEAPWFETTTPSAPPAGNEFEDEFVDRSAETAAAPNAEASYADDVELEPVPRASVPLLLAASGVMILLAATAVMLVAAMLQKPQVATAAAAPVVPSMTAAAEALPAPTITAPDPAAVEEPPVATPVRRAKKKAAPLMAIEPTQITDHTPAIVAPAETEAPAAAPATEEKKKKGLFGKKKDR